MSMATGGSSAGSLPVGQHGVYDLAVERDVIALLRAIHVSTQPLDIKNYLRDLVFSVRFNGGTEVDQALLATFKTHGFAVTFGAAAKSGGPEAVVPPAPAPRAEAVSQVVPPPMAPQTKTQPKSVAFGIVRQAPSFARPVHVPTPTPTPTPTIVAPAVDTAPVAVEPAPVVTPVAPVVQTQPAPVSEAPAPAPAPVPVPAPVVESAPVNLPAEPSVAGVVENPSERIAAIKREVNAMVGNPVNLIDVNNEVGREYMNALLDAMKKSLGATPAHEVERAMARLERSFVSVKEALARGPVAAPEPASSPATHEAPVAAAIEPEAPSAPVVTPLPEPQPEPVVEVRHVAVNTPVTSSVSETVPDHNAAPVSGFVSVAAAERGEPAQAASAAAPLPPPAAPEVLATLSAPDTSEVITPVAKEKQLRELMEARKAAEAVAARQRAEATAHNPLMADDVNAGLKQLLSEWKLFKSSGIFGTGPSGDEHPLYKKLAPLTIAAVLAGRFEGATPEVKRSIADYMNGWRYEEGITHEQGETFEYYLRRVIRHILDKHKASR